MVGSVTVVPLVTGLEIFEHWIHTWCSWLRVARVSTPWIHTWHCSTGVFADRVNALPKGDQKQPGPGQSAANGSAK